MFTHTSAGDVLLLGFDGRDEHLFDEVRRVCDEWRADGGRPVLVSYRHFDRTRPCPLERLRRLAAAWRVVVVPEPAGGAGALQRMIGELLEEPGVVGIDPVDVWRVLGTPAVGAYRAAPYEPGADAWVPPREWVALCRTAERMVVSIGCAPDTSLRDVNAVCDALLVLAPRSCDGVIGGPVAVAPVVQVLALTPA